MMGKEGVGGTPSLYIQVTTDTLHTPPASYLQCHTPPPDSQRGYSSAATTPLGQDGSADSHAPAATLPPSRSNPSTAATASLAAAAQEAVLQGSQENMMLAKTAKRCTRLLVAPPLVWLHSQKVNAGETMLAM